MSKAATAPGIVAVAFAVLASQACGGVGRVGDSSHGGAGAAGSASDPGAAGTMFFVPGSGAAGTSAPTGAAGTSASTGAAGTSAPTGAAGTGATTGVAGRPGGTGAAGTSGAAGSGSSTGAAGTASSGGAGAGGAAGSGARDAGAGETGSPPVTQPNCKRGEAYASNSIADLQALKKGITWWYNWTTSPEKAVAADFDKIGVEFVPMIWGGDPDPATIEKQIPASAKYVLGFNEPNFGAQSHIPAAQAAALWPKIEQIARDKNLKIGSPSPNYCAGDCNDTDPIHYLDTFFAACTGCQVDFIAAHWYACTGDALKSYLSKLKKYGKPIWLTEFSCMDAGDHTAAGEQTYMKTAVAILEADPMIFRYSWFTGRWPNPNGVSLLGSGSGTLTDLGNLYMTLPAAGVCGP